MELTTLLVLATRTNPTNLSLQDPMYTYITSMRITFGVNRVKENFPVIRNHVSRSPLVYDLSGFTYLYIEYILFRSFENYKCPHNEQSIIRLP
nr:MAG TPA: hypothetical protein [Caudoviricetes sp.]